MSAIPLVIVVGAVALSVILTFINLVFPPTDVSLSGQAAAGEVVAAPSPSPAAPTLVPAAAASGTAVPASNAEPSSTAAVPAAHSSDDITGPSATAIPAGEELVHIVAGGETLSVIADLYDSSVAAIAEANDITDPRVIRVGQRLTIPTPEPAPTSTPP